jgi:hypothetical protein
VSLFEGGEGRGSLPSETELGAEFGPVKFEGGGSLLENNMLACGLCCSGRLMAVRTAIGMYTAPIWVYWVNDLPLLPF